MKGRDSVLPLGGVVLTLLACNASIAVGGGPCDTEGEVRCVSKKEALFCAGGTWRTLPCRGTPGCVDLDDAACNNEGYLLDEPCVEKSTSKCSVDGSAVLTCRDNRWATQAKCEEQTRCVADASGARCDSARTPDSVGVKTDF